MNTPCFSLPRQAPFAMVFCKRPLPGVVKTRLACSVGAMRAAALYRAFVQDVFSAVDQAGALSRCCVAPEAPVGRGWPGKGRVIWEQQGAGLGERMANAFARAFAPRGQGGADMPAALLTGTDVPQLAPAVLREAWRRLEHADLVFGPALDGGYFLVGMRRQAFRRELFQGMTWSGPHVLEQSLARARGLRTSLLPPLRDVDELSDLLVLLREAHKTAMPATRRAAALLLEGKGIF